MTQERGGGRRGEEEEEREGGRVSKGDMKWEREIRRKMQQRRKREWRNDRKEEEEEETVRRAECVYVCVQWTQWGVKIYNTRKEREGEMEG